MANLTVEQTYAVFNEIAKQATGKELIAPVDGQSFVSSAETTLRAGYDPVLGAISQTLSRTIFSNRPYSAKFKGLMMDSIKFGNHVRKINVIDKPLEADDRYNLIDGQSVDHYKVNKPKVLQTNFYGQNTFSKSLTIFKDQLDTAFENESQFGSFISMILANSTDILEQNRENVARATLANLIGAKKLADPDNVIYLFDKYYDETGIQLTEATYRQPTYFVPFTKWLFSFIKTVSGLMTERSAKYHMNYTIDGSEATIMRHTPVTNQKLYLYTKEINDIDASVLSDVYHDNYLSKMDYEAVNFWQSIDTPMAIQTKPAYVDANGVAIEEAQTITLDNVLGVLFDEEACGMTAIEQYQLSTPMNARGGFSNIWWHENFRCWNDLSENCVVFILGAKPTLGSIEVSEEPEDVTYEEGDYFNPAGLVVKAKYSDDTYKLVGPDAVSYSPSLTTPLQESDTKVTITYTEGSTSKTVDQSITVTGS